jgi:hypothetical protein
MTVHDHLTEYDRVPVVEFGDSAAPDPEALAVKAARATGAVPSAAPAWAIRGTFDGPRFDDLFAGFLATVDTALVTHLVIGYWGASYDSSTADPSQLLAAAAPRLPGLKAIFLGDIQSEEAEISWIEQSDITPLLTAYPALERLDVRGGTGLALAPLRSAALKTLRFEAGGLPAAVVQAVAASDLPGLETLDLWLGTPDYGGDASVSDLAPILSGATLPSLRRLGLMNSEAQDDVCSAVASAPVVARLTDLDLSMGVLTDTGAEALLSGQPLTHLRTLSLEHHYLTDPMMARLRAALPAVDLRLDRADAQADDEWRYVAVDE